MHVSQAQQAEEQRREGSARRTPVRVLRADARLVSRTCASALTLFAFGSSLRICRRLCQSRAKPQSKHTSRNASRSHSPTRESMSILPYIRRLTSVTGLLPTAFVAWRTLNHWRPSQIQRNARARQRELSTGIPVPPGGLIFTVTGTPDVEWFLDSGRRAAECFRSTLQQIGRPLESFEAVLDFGCGCGRVLRQWRALARPRVFGSDYNPKLVAWARENLPFATVEVNDLRPPLRFPMDSSIWRTRFQLLPIFPSSCSGHGWTNSVG
jgi:hypothetical protein